MMPGWHPVALSKDIEPGTSNGTHLFGRELVVWRDTAGAVHVWEDRCPHRGMRLSFGFVRGDRIACLYHGWQYDSAGQCRYIPAHPDLTPPATIRVESWPCVERLGMVWLGEGPATEPLPDAEAVTPVRSIHIDCEAEDAVAHILAGGAGAAERLAPSLVRVAAGAETVFAGVQPSAEALCALHIVAAGEREAVSLKRISAWAEALRKALEAPAAGIAA
jgi:nitrite reductase/ring-hydroxylating ferredoxin subunit